MLMYGGSLINGYSMTLIGGGAETSWAKSNGINMHKEVALHLTVVLLLTMQTSFITTK